MCDRAKTAVEVIKSQKRKTLTKEETLMLFQKVIEDQEKMGKRIESLETKVDAGFAEIKELLTKKNSFWDRVPLLKDIPNLAWVLLIISVCIIGSILGANLDFLKDTFKIGG